MGSVRRSPRNKRRWEARYTDPLGQYVSKHFDDKAAANAWLRKNEGTPADHLRRVVRRVLRRRGTH
jgi:hypothetical protein